MPISLSMSWRMRASARKPKVPTTAPPLGAGSDEEELGASGSCARPLPPLTLAKAARQGP